MVKGCNIVIAGCRKKDVNIVGGSDIDSPVATGAEDCAKRCDSLPACKAWVFNPADMKCWRKNGFSGDSHRPGLWTGIKDCTIDNTVGNTQMKFLWAFKSLDKANFEDTINITCHTFQITLFV